MTFWCFFPIWKFAIYTLPLVGLAGEGCDFDGCCQRWALYYSCVQLWHTSLCNQSFLSQFYYKLRHKNDACNYVICYFSNQLTKIFPYSWNSISDSQLDWSVFILHRDQSAHVSVTRCRLLSYNCWWKFDFNLHLIFFLCSSFLHYVFICCNNM